MMMLLAAPLQRRGWESNLGPANYWIDYRKWGNILSRSQIEKKEEEAGWFDGNSVDVFLAQLNGDEAS